MPRYISPWPIVAGLGLAALAVIGATEVFGEEYGPAGPEWANRPFKVKPIVHEVHPRAILRKCREVAKRRGFIPARNPRTAGCATYDAAYTFCEIVVPDRDWPPYFTRAEVVYHEEARCKGYDVLPPKWMR